MKVSIVKEVKNAFYVWFWGVYFKNLIYAFCEVPLIARHLRIRKALTIEAIAKVLITEAASNDTATKALIITAISK